MWPFTRRSPTETKQNPVGSVISAYHVGQPVWTERNFERLADEGFVKNAIAFKCVKMIAGGAAMVPWILKGTGGKEITKHPILDLLNHPAPMIGGHAVFEAFYAYLLLQGNTYLAASRPTSRKGPPKELWNLRPDRVRVIPGPFGVAQAYEYEANGIKQRFQVDPITGAGDILHVKEFHPINDWYGLGRIEPGAYAVDRHNAASAHNKALLDNGARPSGALIFEPVKTAGGAEQSAPQVVVDAAKHELDDQYKGADKAGKAMVFSGNVKWQEMGISPRDMDFANGKDDAARDICASFGVPHILVVPGQSTYNNVKEAKLELWEDTILPLMDMGCDALSGWLSPMFGEGLTLAYDLDEISALEPRREEKRKSILALYDKGLINDTEARESLQYGPRPAGALRLQRGDGPILQALVTGAGTNPAIIEPLYRYFIAAGLLAETTTLEEFTQTWDNGPSRAELLAAAGVGPDGKPVGDGGPPHGEVVPPVDPSGDGAINDGGAN